MAWPREVPVPARELNFVRCDGRPVAAAFDHETLRLWVWDDPTAQPRALATFPTRIEAFAPSPTAPVLAILLDVEDGVTPPRLVFLRLDGSMREPVLDFRLPAEPHWSADGSRLLFIVEGGLLVVDADGRCLERIPRGASHAGWETR